MSNHYDILGVSPTATHDEIQAQYRALAKVVHPDMGGDAVMFAVLEESYEVLRDPMRRAEYDATLRTAAAPATPREPAEQEAGVTWGLHPSTSAERAAGEELAKHGITSWHQTPDQYVRVLAKRIPWIAAYVVVMIAARSCR